MTKTLKVCIQILGAFFIICVIILFFASLFNPFYSIKNEDKGNIVSEIPKDSITTITARFDSDLEKKIFTNLITDVLVSQSKLNNITYDASFENLVVEHTKFYLLINTECPKYNRNIYLKLSLFIKSILRECLKIDTSKKFNRGTFLKFLHSDYEDYG